LLITHSFHSMSFHPEDTKIIWYVKKYSNKIMLFLIGKKKIILVKCRTIIQIFIFVILF